MAVSKVMTPIKITIKWIPLWNDLTHFDPLRVFQSCSNVWLNSLMFDRELIQFSGTGGVRIRDRTLIPRRKIRKIIPKIRKSYAIQGLLYFGVNETVALRPLHFGTSTRPDRTLVKLDDFLLVIEFEVVTKKVPWTYLASGPRETLSRCRYNLAIFFAPYKLTDPTRYGMWVRVCIARWHSKTQVASATENRSPK